MDTNTVISITGAFFKLAGDILADLKSRRLAEIDLALLRLKKDRLTEALEDCKRQWAEAVKMEKASKHQDLISRRLGNSTIVDNMLRAIEKDAADELEKSMREYNRTIEEIALLERKVKEQSGGMLKKILGGAMCIVLAAAFLKLLA